MHGSAFPRSGGRLSITGKSIEKKEIRKSTIHCGKSQAATMSQERKSSLGLKNLSNYVK